MKPNRQFHLAALSAAGLLLAACGQTASTPSPTASKSIPLTSLPAASTPQAGAPFKLKTLALPPNEADPLVLYPGTQVLEVQPLSADSTEAGTNFTFSAKDVTPEQLKVDNVLIIPPTEAFQQGYIVKVQAVELGADVYTVKATSASLEDAVESGTLDLSVPLSASDVVSETNLPGVSKMTAGGPGSLQALGNLGSVTKTFTNVVVCSNGADQVVLNGYFNADVDAFIHASFKKKWWLPANLQHVDTGVSLNEHSKLQLSGSCNGKFQHDTTLSTVSLGTVRSGSGVVWFTAEMEFILGASGEITAQIDYQVEHDLALKEGVEWNAGKGFSAINQVTQTLRGLGTKMDVASRSEAYIGVRPTLKLWNVGSVYVAPTIFGSGESAVNALNYNYCLKAGLNVAVGADLRIFSWPLGHWEQDLGRTNWPVQCGRGVIGVPPTSTPYTNVTARFTDVLGRVEINKIDPSSGVATLVGTLPGNGNFDLTSYLNATGETSFGIVSVATRSPVPFGYFNRNINMDVLANGAVIYAPPGTGCRSCHSAQVYTFHVNKANGTIRF